MSKEDMAIVAFNTNFLSFIVTGFQSSRSSSRLFQSERSNVPDCSKMIVALFTKQITQILITVLATTPFIKFINCDCSIRVNSNEFAPFVLHNNTRRYDFIVPDEGIINLKRGEKVALACPDPKNALEASNANITTASCISGDNLRVANRDYSFTDLKCRKTIRGTTKTTSKSCGNGKGYLINIGYTWTRNQWFTLIEVCYDDTVGATLYTQHVLIGNEIENASKSSYRPGFSTEALGSDVAASVAYKQAFQKSTFNQLLGSSALANLYINRKSYLARGHLSPDADFLFAAWQFTTYFYINVCPQWQVINGGNWKSLEFAVRKTAEKHNRNVNVITGTYGVLTLPDINNNFVEIHLVSGNKLPVPEYVWKIIYDEESNDAIVLIVYNNPFVEEITEDNYLCEDVCQNYGWSCKSWLNHTKGFVHCCEYRDFAKTVRTAPRLKVNGVLYGLNNLDRYIIN